MSALVFATVLSACGGAVDTSVAPSDAIPVPVADDASPPDRERVLVERQHNTVDASAVDSSAPGPVECSSITPLVTTGATCDPSTWIRCCSGPLLATCSTNEDGGTDPTLFPWVHLDWFATCAAIGKDGD